MTKLNSILKLTAGVLALSMFPFSSATAMTVQPVIVNLAAAGRNMTQIITVQNTFTTPLPVELRIEELTFVNGELKGTGKDPGDLLVFPPQALIQPGETQSFRIQYVGDPALAKSKHYYVTVAQLPVKLPAGKSAIQILYNFQVLVSIAPNGVQPALKIDSVEIGKDSSGKPVPMLTLSNASTAHAYLSSGHLRIVERDAAGKDVFHRTLSGPEIQQTMGFGLVGAGQTRHVMIPVELPIAGGSVDAQFTPEK